MKLLKHFFLVTILFIGFCSFTISNSLNKKIDKELIKFLDTKSFRKEEINLDKETLKQISLQISDGKFYNLYNQTNEIVNLLYVGKAPSHVSYFDYMVIFNKEDNIVYTKVLIYREDYGFEITSKRWLKQFIGIALKDNLVYKENIDAISGATISATSMTREMNLLLKDIQLLKENNAI